MGMISGMSKPVPALAMTDGQREVLESLARSQSGPHREVVRAKALLMAADGVAHAFRRGRSGQVRAGPRGARPQALDPGRKLERIVTLTEEYRPEGETHW